MSEYRGKRALDVLIVAILAIPAVLVVAAAALWILLDDGRPVLFRQVRVGRGGAPFQLLKLRTMSPAPPGDMFPDADLITRSGRWLRRFSLDELPQLWNVARGEMSIVGPRPTLAYQVQRYSERQRRRLAVRPGLTGLAQVRGRNAMAWADRIELDLEYIDRQSLLLDLRLIASSALSVLGGGGVEGHPRDDPLARIDGGN